MNNPSASPARKPSALLDTRVIYCGDNLEQLKKLPDACIDLIYIDPPFNSNRNYEVFWGETQEKRRSFEDRHESTQAYIEFMRPRCVELARVLKKTGSFYYHCDWHASHYVKVMLDQIFGENNFQNEIVWKRTYRAQRAPKRPGTVHDTILLLRGPESYTWNKAVPALRPDYIEKFFDHRTLMDADGAYGFDRRWIRPVTAVNRAAQRPAKGRHSGIPVSVEQYRLTATPHHSKGWRA